MENSNFIMLPPQEKVLRRLDISPQERFGGKSINNGNDFLMPGLGCPWLPLSHTFFVLMGDWEGPSWVSTRHLNKQHITAATPTGLSPLVELFSQLGFFRASHWSPFPKAISAHGQGSSLLSYQLLLRGGTILTNARPRYVSLYLCANCPVPWSVLQPFYLNPEPQHGRTSLQHAQPQHTGKLLPFMVPIR